MAGIHYLDARAPEGIRLYAVGDIHGRLDLLTAMHARIMEEIMRDRPADWRIVYLGDYEDRGPDSRGVIEFLARAVENDSRVMALAGNHDLGFLEFVDQGTPNGLFASYGGRETARSYGIELDLSGFSTTERGRKALLDAVPDNHIAFLRSRPLSVEFGDFFFCHAGIRPGVPLARQDPEDLVWIRNEFHAWPGLHPKVIVHGHTSVGEVEIMPNRVNIDTGAWMSGRLTALAVDAIEKRLIEVSDAR